MRNKSCFARPRWLRRASKLVLAGALLLAAASAGASSPDWFREAARTPTGNVPADAKAVVLLDEQITTVKDNGDIYTVYRAAMRILRPEGREFGVVGVTFDNQTRLTYLKAWCLPADGKEYELKERDATETSVPNGMFYDDLRAKVMRIPAAEPGNVIGYEYEQRRRPYVLEDAWQFQNEQPTVRARFTLNLPHSWEYKVYWQHHDEVQPARSGDNQWTWELHDIPGVEQEVSMPTWRAVAGRMSISYFGGGDPRTRSSWQAVGTWMNQLTADRRQSSPAIQQKVAELTAGKSSTLEKMQALASFVQHDIRYVAIEVGIGGYQPHAAPDVFNNRYGDCKDKATLLGVMLKQIGIDSDYVLLNVHRGVVTPAAPSALSFDHVILAIHLPSDVNTVALYATKDEPQIGKVLFFDPTSESTGFGSLPAPEEGNRGLLVAADGGHLVDLPLLPPNLNRLLRFANLSLTPDGDLVGEVEEILGGPLAAERRYRLRSATEQERRKYIEDFLVRFLSGFSITEASVQNVDKLDDNLVVHYKFVAPHYAKRAGNLLLIRPRVMGQKSEDYFRGKERQYPVEFDAPTLQSDIFEIHLPPGYKVDELPPTTSVTYDFAEYKSEVNVEGSLLRYKRNYTIKEVMVPKDHMSELRKFNDQIATDENGSAVLTKSQ